MRATIVLVFIIGGLATETIEGQHVQPTSRSADLAVSVTVTRSCTIAVVELVPSGESRSRDRVTLSCTNRAAPPQVRVMSGAQHNTVERDPSQTSPRAAGGLVVINF